MYIQYTYSVYIYIYIHYSLYIYILQCYHCSLVTASCSQVGPFLDRALAMTGNLESVSSKLLPYRLQWNPLL